MALALAFIAADLAALAYQALRGRLSATGWLFVAAWFPILVILTFLAIFLSPAGGVVAIAACAAAWAVRSYGRTTSPISRPAKLLLLGLRILALVLVALWVIRPTRESRHYEQVYPAVLIGLDSSKSMGNLDMTAELTPATAEQADRAISRFAALKLALRRHHNELKQLARERQFMVFKFDTEAGAAADLPERAEDWETFLDAATGSATAIGDSTDEAVSEYFRTGREVVAVLLCSDGANNTAYRCTTARLIEKMNNLNVRVYTLGVGRGPDDPPGASRALTVKDLRVPDKVDAFNKLPIAATIETLGLAKKSEPAREIEIKCYFGEELIKTERVRITKDRQTYDWPAAAATYRRKEGRQARPRRGSRPAASVHRRQVPLRGELHSPGPGSCPRPGAYSPHTHPAAGRTRVNRAG
jgi:hypothetical protein